MGGCVVTLSTPLLQFRWVFPFYSYFSFFKPLTSPSRSNKEIKETLLHEMIHAFLFITKLVLSPPPPHPPPSILPPLSSSSPSPLFPSLSLSSLSPSLSNNDRHDDHGENFQRLMYQINFSKVLDPNRPFGGYNITIYHTFHDEVEYHRQHHWECNRFV